MDYNGLFFIIFLLWLKVYDICILVYVNYECWGNYVVFLYNEFVYIRLCEYVCFSEYLFLDMFYVCNV